jgi:molybdate transport system substrate-binding protein
MNFVFVSIFSTILFASTTFPSTAEEVRVLSANNFRPLISSAGTAIETATKSTLSIVYDSTGGVQRRVGAGEVYDLILVEDGVIGALEAQGRITLGSRRRIAKAVMVLVVKPERKLTTNSAAEFRRAIEDARAIAFPSPQQGGLSGPVFARILNAAGFNDITAPKFIFARNTADTIRMVEAGEAEIGASQFNEIRTSKLRFVDIPAALGSEIYLSGGVMTSGSASKKEAAQSILDFLSSPKAAKYIEDNRLRPAK